jgi:DNA polymerase-3 subunit delta'
MKMLIGHDQNMRAFSNALDTGKTHHGWILAGLRGLGKASFAKIAAQKLIDPDNRHSNLIECGSHPDLIILGYQRILRKKVKKLSRRQN